MSGIFESLFFQPIFNLLIFFYNVVPGNDLGIAIILVTIIVKVLLLPLSQKSIRSQKALQELQPKINTLKEKYKNQKEKQAQAMMQLYKEQKVNPLSSCLPLLIQLPFLFAVFRVFTKGLEPETMQLLYSFVENPGLLTTTFFGLDLTTPFALFGILAGIGQYFQTKMLMAKRVEKESKSKGAKDEDMMAMVNKQMTYMMPVITVVLGFTFPAGLMLYWLVTTILTILQQKLLFQNKDNKTPPQIEAKSSV